MPARAHLNPILGIVKKLVLLKHEVIVYNSPEFAKDIESVGAQFRCPLQNSPTFHAEIGKNSLEMAEFLIDTTSKLINPLIIDLKKEKPDCIVHDSLNVWGKIAAAKINVPAICMVPTFVLRPQLLLSFSFLYLEYLKMITHLIRTLTMLHKYQSLYKNIGLSSPLAFDLFTNKEKLNIVFTSRYFQPGGYNFGKDYEFVGPIIYDRKEQMNIINPNQVRKQIIYISLGTIYTNQVEFYKRWISYFRNTQYQVYISIGKDINKKDLGNIPENIIVENYLPQLDILKKSTLFISHGGMNSVNESLYYGVPMLLFPQIHEQKINSARVEKLGAGLWYKQNRLDEGLMRDMVNTLITNNIYKENALKLGSTLKKAGGVQKAVSSLLNYFEN